MIGYIHIFSKLVKGVLSPHCK